MTELQRWKVTEPYLDVQGSLLEGPYYDKSKNELRFIDIMEHKIHFVDLAKGPESLRTVDTGSPIGVTANVERTDPSPDDKEVLVAGAKHGFATLNPETGEPTYIRKVWTEADGEGKAHRMRSNDGNVDSRGRFFVGMMTDLQVGELQHEGALFRLDPDLSLHRLIDDMGISNGLAWNKDETVMYVTDSPSKNIYAYDYDAEKGEISNRRIFFTAPEEGEECFPDGFAMDEEGYFWIALWAGYRVVRVSPEGKIVGEVSLPAKCVSCAEIAGTDLFITTAKDDEVSSDPHGGKLYKVNVGVKGKPRHKFRLSLRS